MKQPKPQKHCKNCHSVIDKALTGTLGASKFCSIECFHAYNRNKMRLKASKETVIEEVHKPNQKRFKKLEQQTQKFQTVTKKLDKEILDRDSDYLNFIRSFPCIVPDCKDSPIHSHHTEIGGMGVKGSDYSCVPLCHKHHTGEDDSIHKLSKEQFEERHGVNFLQYISKYLRIYIRGLRS